MAVAAPAVRAKRAVAMWKGIHLPKAATMLTYLGVAVITLWIVLPMVYVIGSSFSTQGGAGTLSNYAGVLGGHTRSVGYGSIATGKDLLPAIGHSFLVAGMLVVVDLLVAGLCAYGISRFDFRGGRAVYLGMVAARVVPAIAIVGPFFLVFRKLDILNTPWALVISYNVFTLPLAVMVLKNYFDQLPRSLEESAMIDGASRLKTMYLVAAPLARPGITAVGVLVFLEAWSEFFYSLVLTNQLTVPPLLAGFQSTVQFNWNALAAATVLAVIPPVVLAMVFQRNIVAALVSGHER